MRSFGRPRDAKLRSLLPCPSKTADSIMTTQTPSIPHEEIARLAYTLYESRGRRPGHDHEDWLEAESRLRAQAEKKTPPLGLPLVEFGRDGLPEHSDGLAKHPVQRREHPLARDERGSATRQEIRRQGGKTPAPRFGN